MPSCIRNAASSVLSASSSFMHYKWQACNHYVPSVPRRKANSKLAIIGKEQPRYTSGGLPIEL